MVNKCWSVEIVVLIVSIMTYGFAIAFDMKVGFGVIVNSLVMAEYLRFC